jgi:hypothetical protein
MISTDLYITLSFILSFGAPIALAIRELRMLKASSNRPDGGIERTAPAPVPFDDDGLPPLPPSLIPQLDVRPTPVPRVLEPA